VSHLAVRRGLGDHARRRVRRRSNQSASMSRLKTSEEIFLETAKKLLTTKRKVKLFDRQGRLWKEIDIPLGVLEAVVTFSFLLGTRRSSISYTSRVSQPGRSEGFQCRIACLCCRCVADRFARESGCCALLRPARKFLRVACFAQFKQSFVPREILTPHSEQTCSGFGWLTSGTSLSFTSRLLRCVRRVAICCRASLDVKLGFVTEDQIAI